MYEDPRFVLQHGKLQRQEATLALTDKRWFPCPVTGEMEAT
jgi:hypothetical protein